jgi:hypothetical protein
LIIFIGQTDRADFGTVSASRAFGQIDIARMLFYGNPEITPLSLNLFYLRVGDQVDI